MSTIELCRDFDSARYNLLGSIESADKFVRQNSQIDELLNQAAKLFFKHNAHSVFGLGLLHRHHWCNSGERMSQEAGTVSGEAALVTRPVQGALDHTREVPWLWAISEGKYHPLEFTSDPVARALFVKTAEIPEAFFRDLSNLLDESPIGHMLGLAIIQRELHNSMPDDHTLLEFSYCDERESVIHVRHVEDAVESIITTWGFEIRIEPKAGCVEPETKCHPVYKCRCREYTDEDGKKHHQGHESYKERHDQIRGQHNPS